MVFTIKNTLQMILQKTHYKWFYNKKMHYNLFYYKNASQIIFL